MEDATKTGRIRTLNDTLRRQHIGGQVMLTSGVTALAPETQTNILAAVAGFDAFNGDNDPYGEHDCASVTVEGHKVIWKIDYYDSTMTFGSEDSADSAKTKRIMTVMLAEEY